MTAVEVCTSVHCMVTDDMTRDVTEDSFYTDMNATSWTRDRRSSPSSSSSLTKQDKSCTTLRGRDSATTNLLSSVNLAQGNFPPISHHLVPDDVNLDSWQRTHPEQWTSEDVLNLIYFIAMKSSDIEFSSFYGEKFQNVGGAELCSMTEEEFVRREPKYGRMLFSCIQNLLKKCQFLPPDGLEMVKQERQDHVTNIQTEIPITVEELSYDDPELFGDYGRNIVNMFGMNYDIDSSADFCNIRSASDLLSSVAASDSIPTAAEAAAMYDAIQSGLFPGYNHNHHHLQLQKQHQHHMNPDSTCNGTMYPIDLRGDRQKEFRDINEIPWSAGIVTPSMNANDRGRNNNRLKRKREKSLSSDGEGSSSSSSYGGTDGTDGSPNHDSYGIKSISGGKGSHLWEFLCQLLRKSDSMQTKDKIIQWESREEGVFRIIDSKEVASLWGTHKGNKNMTYEKLSRALRWCRTFGFLAALPKEGKFPKKLCFRFGPRATNWRQFV